MEVNFGAYGIEAERLKASEDRTCTAPEHSIKAGVPTGREDLQELHEAAVGWK